jgi:hypothetical protein
MKTSILFFLSFIFCFASSTFAQFERKVLTKLAEGESLVLNESSALANLGDNFCLVVVKYINSKPNFYKITKSGKSGPFSKDEISICEQANENCSDRTEFLNEQNYTPNYVYDAAGTYIEFNGKNFGPYEMVSAVMINSDQTKLYMTITNGGIGYFVCSDGRKVEIKGMPESIMISPDGQNAVVKTTGLYSMADLVILANNPENIDISKLNQIHYTTISGKVIGPFENASLSGWFCKYSNTWILKVDDTVYLDGVIWKTIGSVYPDSFWFIDKNRNAYIDSEGRLIFSDGKVFNYPLCILSEKLGSTVYLKWISIESGEVVLYKRSL